MRRQKKARGLCAIAVILQLLLVVTDGAPVALQCPTDVAADKVEEVLAYSTGVRVNCPLKVSCKLEWLKDGQLLSFDEDGAAGLYLGLGKKPKRLRISLMLPETAGNYTCRCKGCQGPNTTATVTYQLLSPEPAITELMAQYPPIMSSFAPTGRSSRRPQISIKPGLYLSRKSNAKAMFSPAEEISSGGNNPSDSEPFIFRLVVSRNSTVDSAVPPVVNWFQLRSRRRGVFKPLASVLDNGVYSVSEPKMVSCDAGDLGVFHLKKNHKLQCYIAELKLNTVERNTVGQYKSIASLPSLANSKMVSMLFNHRVTHNPADPTSKDRFKRPQVSFSTNTTACSGSKLQLHCQVNTEANVHIVRLLDDGRELSLRNYTPQENSKIQIGNRSLMLWNERVDLKHSIENLTASDTGRYVCIAEALGNLYTREEVVEEMHLTVRACSTGLEVQLEMPWWLYPAVTVGSLLLFGLVLGGLIGLFFFQKGRTDPIVKRLRIVCVDNSDIYSRNRRHANSDSPLLVRSSYYRQESVERPLVPQVVVEQIGASDSRRGGFFRMQRRTWQTPAPGVGSGVSEAGKEIRYIIPSNPQLEIDRKRIQLYRLLGEGAFGTVHSGQVTHSNTTTVDVAVKMLKRDYTEEEMVALVKEMEIMKMMKRNPHLNIIQMVGVCTKDGPFMLLVELAHYGNLRDFLKERKVTSDPADYLNVLPGTRRICFMPCIRPVQLLRFSIDVAQALDFMASIKIVHRDIAARNVLVANAPNRDAVVAKVADFGLTRNLADKDYYRVINEGKLPVKWLAPECLKSRIFSTQSDVWAFGILLYEIFSLGEIPYPGVSPSNIVPHLEAGNLNPQPLYAGPELYSLMKDCWAPEARYRPSFTSIIIRLESMVACYDKTDRP